jgi:hypothetical protein
MENETRNLVKVIARLHRELGETQKETRILVRAYVRLDRELAETQGILTDSFHRLNALEAKTSKRGGYRHSTPAHTDADLLRVLHEKGGHSNE